MVITFLDPTTLTGATPSEPVVFDYSHVYESTWECVDTDGNPVDISALSMPKWTLDISADEALSHPLFHTDSIAPSANAFQLVLAVFDPRIYGWMAGNVDKAAFVTVSAYANFTTAVPSYRFAMPCDMQCTSTFTCPGDLQRALLRELQAAVQRASDSAAYASSAASDVIDAGMVEIRAQADRASGYADSAEQSSADASSAADTAAEHASDAQSSADAAAASADNASTSASSANASAESALASAQSALGFSNQASGYSDTAASHAASALQSSQQAATSAEAASASEIMASDYADNASDYAANASASATAAQGHASSATVSAQSAAADASVTSDNKDAAVIAASEASSNAATVVDYLAMALTAKNAATNAAAAADTDAGNAHVWAEGSDDAVEALGGEHSARTWAQLAGQSSTSAIDAATSASAASNDAVSAKNAAVSARNDATAAAASAAENALLTQGLYNQTAALVATMDVGAVVGYGLVVDGTRLSFSWTDPNDVPPVRWYKTRLIMKTGGFPNDETDGTVLVDETVRNQYQHTSFEYDAGIASDYYFALFTQSTGGAWNTGDDAPRFTTDALTLTTLAMLSRSGSLLSYPGMEIGAKVDIRLSDQFPRWRIKLADIDYAGDNPDVSSFMYDHSRTHNSIWISDLLLCRYDSMDALMLQFDAKENSYGVAEDETFMDGRTYWKWVDPDYVQLVQGTDYENGGSLDAWRSAHDMEVYVKNAATRVSNGSNSWKESNLRQWLNADTANYFQPQNPFDVNADGVTGAMVGMSEDLKALIQPVYNKTARNTAAVAGWGGGDGYDLTVDRLWIPSQTEVAGTKTNNINEGIRLAYFRDIADTAALCIQTDEGGTARHCWLRSPNVSYLNYEYYINTSGSIAFHNASSAYAILPAFAL